MKPFKLLQILVLLALSSCESCEEKVWTELPPETQIGANTFGCYVNGELFVNGISNVLGEPGIYAVYSREMHSTSIYAVNRKLGGRMAIFDLQNPININYQIEDLFSGDIFIGLPYNMALYSGYYSFFSETDLVITKFDTINKIVSGRFNFILTAEKNIKDTIKITDGRFDIKLDINN